LWFPRMSANSNLGLPSGF